MTGRLEGIRVLVTGASRGIGEAVARACAAEGANLVLNARGPARLEETAQAIRDMHGVEVMATAGDVTDRDAMTGLVETAIAAGPIDVLVNNAGIHKAARFLDFTPDDFRELLEVNFFGVLHITQLVLPHMVAAGGGRIINLGSTAGKWGSRNQSAYNVSKHAVIGLTRCLALEYAPHNVLVNAICPWVVDTEMGDALARGHAAVTGAEPAAVQEAYNNANPLKRNVRPDEVAGLAVYLASPEASFVNGQSWTMDGGFTLI